jgi:predicted phosphodiesterase
MKRFVWLSDTHLNLSVLPFLKRRFVRQLNSAGPDGLFLTGDISSGPWFESDLRFLARHFHGPIYFVLGNHDYHKRHITSVHSDVRRLCQEQQNLHWMTDEPIVHLDDDVALIGTEGWYDAQNGDQKLLKYTSDWLLTFDFLHLDGMEARVAHWRQLAKESADMIAERLEAALEDHKTVYVMTHFPPWVEATRAQGTLLEKFWLPYNTNVAMGQAIERVMEGRKKKRCIVLAGHTHTPCHIRVSNSIECMVARASYLGSVSAEETIVI